MVPMRDSAIVEANQEWFGVEGLDGICANRRLAAETGGAWRGFSRESSAATAKPANDQRVSPGKQSKS